MVVFEQIPDEEWQHFFDVNVLSGAVEPCLSPGNETAQLGAHRFHQQRKRGADTG
ncbi:MAG: hypothetical protein JWM99_3068 [Verrucomicrobiales bacterium]|jgi:hypothetical protein|nr:hypothetical protein [Verrucomicrobiales bacterium]